MQSYESWMRGLIKKTWPLFLYAQGVAFGSDD